jgi:hypothetical protein
VGKEKDDPGEACPELDATSSVQLGRGLFFPGIVPPSSHISTVGGCLPAGASLMMYCCSQRPSAGEEGLCVMSGSRLSENTL